MRRVLAMAFFKKQADKGVSLQGQQSWTGKLNLKPFGPATDEKAAVPKNSADSAPSKGRNYLDRGSRISGKLYFDETAEIDGQVEGEIKAQHGLVIGENAVVTARLNASFVVVAGKVSGDITTSQRIELRPSAKVIGNLASPMMVIHEGASLAGHCTTLDTRASVTR